MKSEPRRTALDDRSKLLRRQILRTLHAGGRGHLGAAFSLVEMLRVLFDDVLRYDPAQPKWPERDRFLLSKGHGCAALYVLLAEKGFFPEAELWKFCQPQGMLGGHPDWRTPGVEASTGSLGHGLSLATGFALAAAMEKSSRRTFVVLGDGESNEGTVWEAALSARQHKLSNLIVLTDYNKQQSYGSTAEVIDLEPLADKWRSFGFAVEEVDGHDVTALRQVLQRAPLAANAPTSIICHTVKGKGIREAENNLAWHHVNRFPDELLQRLLSEVESY
jgi:transketolase